MKAWTILALGALLVGCYEDEPDPLPYPPLDPRALVGCWEFIVPDDMCSARCFDRQNGFYHTSSFTLRDRETREDSGTFSLERNRVNLNSMLKTTSGKFERNDDALSYTIIRDTLIPAEPLGNSRFIRVHPDSFPCGLKPWTLFQKPAGWDSLIKPY